MPGAHRALVDQRRARSAPPARSPAQRRCLASSARGSTDNGGLPISSSSRTARSISSGPRRAGERLEVGEVGRGVRLQPRIGGPLGEGQRLARGVDRAAGRPRCAGAEAARGGRARGCGAGRRGRRPRARRAGARSARRAVVVLEVGAVDERLGPGRGPAAASRPAGRQARAPGEPPRRPASCSISKRARRRSASPSPAASAGGCAGRTRPQARSRRGCSPAWRRPRAAAPRPHRARRPRARGAARGRPGPARAPPAGRGAHGGRAGSCVRRRRPRRADARSARAGRPRATSSPSRPAIASSGHDVDAFEQACQLRHGRRPERGRGSSSPVSSSGTASRRRAIAAWSEVGQRDATCSAQRPVRRVEPPCQLDRVERVAAGDLVDAAERRPRDRLDRPAENASEARQVERSELERLGRPGGRVVAAASGSATSRPARDVVENARAARRPSSGARSGAPAPTPRRATGRRRPRRLRAPAVASVRSASSTVRPRASGSSSAWSPTVSSSLPSKRSTRPPSAIDRSSSAGLATSTRNPAWRLRRTACRQSAVLPIPGSPRMTSEREPPIASSRNTSTRARSVSRPTRSGTRPTGGAAASPTR